MNHGEILERRGTRTDAGPETEFVDKQGNVVYRGPTMAHTYSVNLVYCKNCGPVEAKGIFGGLGCQKCNALWDE